MKNEARPPCEMAERLRDGSDNRRDDAADAWLCRIH